MAAVVLLLSMAAAATFSPVSGGGGRFLPGVLNLERAFPVDQKVEVEELKARDRAHHARILQSFAGGIVDFSVLGTSDPFLAGLYFTTVKLGTPPREFNVQIDTGSDILWLSCDSCTDCPRTSGLGIELNFFSAAASSSSSTISCSDAACASIVRTASAQCSGQSNQCSYVFQYGDGSSTAGFSASDVLHFDTFWGTSVVANSTAPIVFGWISSGHTLAANQGVRDKIASTANRYLTEVRRLPLPQNQTEALSRGFRELEESIQSHISF